MCGACGRVVVADPVFPDGRTLRGNLIAAQLITALCANRVKVAGRQEGFAVSVPGRAQVLCATVAGVWAAIGPAPELTIPPGYPDQTLLRAVLACSPYPWTVTGTVAEVTGEARASVAVAISEYGPSASGLGGVQDQAPLSEAVVEQIAEPADVTVTDASGSLVPDTAGVVVTVAPPDGEVIATGGGKSATSATPTPVMVTATLCTVTTVPRNRKSAPPFC